MARQLVARHLRKGAAKCTAWAVCGTDVKLSHRVLSQLCWCVNQLICSWQLLAWSHRGCQSLFLGLRWQEWRCLQKIQFFPVLQFFLFFPNSFFVRRVFLLTMNIFVLRRNFKMNFPEEKNFKMFF